MDNGKGGKVIYRSVYDTEEDGKTKIVGMTVGCGCCSFTEEMTVQSLDEHILALEVMLEEARGYRYRLSLDDKEK